MYLVSKRDTRYNDASSHLVNHAQTHTALSLVCDTAGQPRRQSRGTARHPRGIWSAPGILPQQKRTSAGASCHALLRLRPPRTPRTAARCAHCHHHHGTLSAPVSQAGLLSRPLWQHTAPVLRVACTAEDLTAASSASAGCQKLPQQILGVVT